VAVAVGGLAWRVLLVNRRSPQGWGPIQFDRPFGLGIASIGKFDALGSIRSTVTDVFPWGQAGSGTLSDRVWAGRY